MLRGGEHDDHVRRLEIVAAGEDDTSAAANARDENARTKRQIRQRLSRWANPRET